MKISAERQHLLLNISVVGVVFATDYGAEISAKFTRAAADHSVAEDPSGGHGCPCGYHGRNHSVIKIFRVMSGPF